MMNWTKTFFGLGLAAGLLLGCGPSGAGSETAKTGEAGTKPERLRIAVIPKGSTHEFWKSVRAGAEDAAKELDIEMTFKGPVKEDDRDSQIKTVEDFVTSQVNGIVLAPLDDTALRSPVTDAQKSGIPVLIIDSGLKDVETVSFVATDNRKGGEIAGQRLVEVLGGKGKVVMMRYQEGSASTTEREEGFLAAIAKAPGIQVVSSNQYAGATVESAQKNAENILAPYRQGEALAVDGIFCPNESSTFGMLRVLQDSGVAGKVKFVGFDSSPKLVEALKAKQIDGLVVQNPRKMGYLGVKSMVESLRGKTVEKRIDTGAELVTPDNIEKPEMAALVAPPK